MSMQNHWIVTVQHKFPSLQGSNTNTHQYLFRDKSSNGVLQTLTETYVQHGYFVM